MNADEILASIQEGQEGQIVIPEIWMWTGYTSQWVEVVTPEQLAQIVAEAKAFEPYTHNEKDFQYKNDVALDDNVAVVVESQWFYGRRESATIYVTPSHWLAKYTPVQKWDGEDKEFWELVPNSEVAPKAQPMWDSRFPVAPTSASAYTGFSVGNHFVRDEREVEAQIDWLRGLGIEILGVEHTPNYEWKAYIYVSRQPTETEIAAHLEKNPHLKWWERDDKFRSL